MQVEARRTAEIAGQYSAARRYPRHLVSAPVITWRLLNSGPHTTRGLTLEISIAGLSAVMCGPPQVGERVSLRVKLLNTRFEAPAIVRHSSAARTGFEFLKVSPAFRRSIETCLRSSPLCPFQYGIDTA